MAKKYYDGDITLNTDWGGDASTKNLPVVGSKVQKVIKESINSKVGYVGRVEKAGQGFYVLARDKETFNIYESTITEDNPYGDLNMDGINGSFDAPFNYKMDITLITPESGYKSTLLNSVNNIIKFRAQTLDNNGSPQHESVTITYRIKTEGGVESSYTAIYDGTVAANGIEYNLDDKLGSGLNTVTITVVGMNTGISAMRRVTYRLIDMYFIDKFDITKRYQFANDNTLAINIGYALKGIGRTRLVWYFDGNLYAEDTLTNSNPTLQNANRTFYFTQSTAKWLKPGVHNLQVSMICKDEDSGEEFYTPIYYREFIVEQTPTFLETPFIIRKASFDYNKKFLGDGITPTIYGSKQFENVNIEYAVYYNGQSECLVTTQLKYGLNITDVSSESLPMVSDGFSALQSKLINLPQEGIAEILLTASGRDNNFKTSFNVEVGASDMKITTVTDSIALSLNAFGRSNNSSDRDSWTYTDENGNTITTDFSKNEYIVISTLNSNGGVIAPSDANESNTLNVDSLPVVENEDYKYILFNNDYYIWSREFDWSNTSGWSDNKLKLSNGNSITINYTPFSSDKYENLKLRGATFEFEFETTNVYNDDAIICRICGRENFAPGISIYASGAELVISRTVDTPVYDKDGNLININAGYIKAVSTKYKAEESNRISFVITADGDKNADGSDYRNRILKIYVNGELCGAYPYDKGANFINDSKITFRGSEEACVNISSIQIYQRELTSNEILNNYIYYRNDVNEKASIYKRNDVMLGSNDEIFDPDKLKSQLPVMVFYQKNASNSLDDIHQEKKNKKLTRFFDVVYTNIQNPSKNFFIRNAYVTPQGTSSMNYPVKNLRLYTGKKDDANKYYSELYVGSNIFIDGNSSNLSEDNLNIDCKLDTKKTKNKYSFKDGAAAVNCWCLKADFAESSSSHNTGTARYWNNVMRSNGYATKAQIKAEKNNYKYDVRTCIDGFPIVVFYQQLGNSVPRFEGKYNFNNDKSTEDVFGFTGGGEIKDQEVKYFYIGKERPIIHSETNEDNEVEYACSFAENVQKYDIENPTTESPLYVSDTEGNWYMLRGKELLDNPKMECWELLNSVNEMALFKTAKGFAVGDDDEKVGLELENGFDEAFESRYPDCGDYYHYNSLRRFIEWLVSCRYLDIDNSTGECVPFKQLPLENYHLNNETERLLSICSLSKQKGTITFDFPGVNFYREVEYEVIKSAINEEGYRQANIDDDILASLVYLEVTEIPKEKIEGYDYLKCEDKFWKWLPSNLLITDEIPSIHEVAYDFVKVGEVYYVWNNTYNLEDYHETQWVDDSAVNRALKFAIEKYDHIDMEKMAAYYIYLMRFGGVDQTVKNSMLTTEGPAIDDPNSTLPSLWYFINYDNDTILGVKNDGRLVFDPYITRQTKDGTGYVYAGRESTLWNNLEADIQFMETVTKVDNVLAEGEKNSQFALSYNNAIREYDTNQSDKWCERIYNKDAERKYIQTYVDGWVQKIAADNSETHVYEDYLYDVHGSRSAHRKWWLGRRFNVFDSRFCNTNFMNSLIKFRSTNLPAGAEIKIKSGEPVFYAWGHDNTVTEMTPTAIQPGDYYNFITKSAFNIGSYLELMGAANIATLDLRGCVGALTEIDVTGCYLDSIGTKMKEIIVGDHNRSDLYNISSPNMKFSGLDKASKLEYLDITNIRNIMALDGLNTLLNIRKLYAEGSSVATFTFADGAMIETLKLPSTTETLSLTRSSLIDYNGISFENNNYSNLMNLTIDNCSQLMTDASFVLDWLSNKTPEHKANIQLNLQGIDWYITGLELEKLIRCFDGVGTSGTGRCNVSGKIKLTEIDDKYALQLKELFGENCFKPGSIVYIEAPSNIYINIPENIWEGKESIRCDITPVGIDSYDNLSVTSLAVFENEDGVEETIPVEYTDGIINVDTTTLLVNKRDYITYTIAESKINYKRLIINVSYRTDGLTRERSATSYINKRDYPNGIDILSLSNSYNNFERNWLKLDYNPDSVDNTMSNTRGYFSVKWEMVSGGDGYNTSIALYDTDKETAYIQAIKGWDGLVTLRATVTQDFSGEVLCTNEKVIEFTDPSTIITTKSNPEVCAVLIEAGILTPDKTGFAKLNKNEASAIQPDDFVKTVIENSKEVKRSIFYNNNEITTFLEFRWFTSFGASPNNTDFVGGLFEGCTKLKEISLSNSFKYTKSDMFKKCTSLQNIYGEFDKYVDDTPIYSPLQIERIESGFASDCTKLINCTLSVSNKYIGADAFANCKSLETLRVPTSDDAIIEYTTDSTPFKGCVNLTFEGAPYIQSASNKYQVKDGALYENNGDSLTLIHMGKDSLMENIPSDINTSSGTKTPVYACAYSMESRTEEHLVVPENVIFNGNNILTNSKGNSLTLKCIIGNNIASGLFRTTSFKGNYTFASGETTIPQSAFYGVGDMFKLVIPEGITSLGGDVFYSSSITEIHLPSSLLQIGSSCFWLSDLKYIYFNSSTPPVIINGDFFDVMPEAFYVSPLYIDTYRDVYNYDGKKKFPLIVPFLKINTLYNEGYIRIIQNGNYILNDDEYVIKVGGLDVQVIEGDDYMKYTCDSNISNIQVTLNNEVIGEIDDLYTTIYLGDNSMLFQGNGVNFEHGVYDDEILDILNTNGWFYDKRFKGVRSNPDYKEIFNSNATEITLSLPNYIDNRLMNINFGQYSYTTTDKNKTYAYIKDSNGESIFTNDNGNDSLGYNKQITAKTSDGIFTFGFTNGSTIKTGINGIVLNKLGDSIYSDPELITPYSMNTNNITQTITVNLNANTEIPNTVVVTVTDNKSHTYRKYWNGEPLAFTIPIGYNFTVFASDFISTMHKKYAIVNPMEVNNEFIELTYIGKSGIELSNNIISYYGETEDWFVDLTKYNGSWGTPSIKTTNSDTNEIIQSDADGYSNTIYISSIDNESICCKALTNHNFNKNLIGFIPSYVDCELFKLKLPEINDFLVNQNKEPLTIDNCWLSETYNEDYAWTSDGNKIPKEDKLDYLIFGKYIM